eukprot:903110-Rhodomonas_salina.1
MDWGAHEICASPPTLMGQESLKSGKSDGLGSTRDLCLATDTDESGELEIRCVQWIGEHTRSVPRH